MSFHCDVFVLFRAVVLIESLRHETVVLFLIR